MDGSEEWRGCAGQFRDDWPQQRLLHEFFEVQADARPQAVAIECDGRRLTYAEVEQQANRLARLLRAKGIGPGHCVAILLPRSIDPYLAILATLKSGAAYVPLDPDYPEDRVAYIVSDCQASLLITSEALAAKHQAASAEVLVLERAEEALAAQSAERLTQGEVGVTPADLCYVIYTSGTTGRPKGVQIEHRSACHLVATERRLFRVGPEDRVYQGFSLAFDASVEEVWLAFAAGATLCGASAEMVHAGQDLAPILTAAEVTVVSTVPTLLAMLEDDLPTVRLLILGGEPCPQDLARRWCRPGRRMVNTYGPTEATVIATYADLSVDRPVTIGRPLPGYEVRLLDPELRPVPPGTAGELHIGGAGLARGYVGLPEPTAAKFIASPFAGEPGASARLYKTGDLARLSPTGEIEFLGRIDSQVKIRGFRVELSEIEAVLVRCPGVQAAAVALRDDAPGAPQLVGYIVPREGENVEGRALRAALRERLPAYMVPALFERIEALPTLPSGKVDRRALPKPRGRTLEPVSPPVVPRDPLARRLAEVWGRLFDPSPVGLNDDFFVDLGGHSLLAARMVSELRTEPGFRSLSVLDVYHHPTIEGLAAVLRARGEEPAALAVEGPQPQLPPAWKHFLCGLAQIPGLYVILGFFSLQWLGPYLTYTWMIDKDYAIPEAIAAALAALVAVYPLMLVVGLVVKWTVIGRFKAGHYPLWGWYYYRWWFTNAIIDISPLGYLAGTPLMNAYLRLLGARIGADAFIATDNVSTFDLISVGEEASVGTDATLLGATVEDGWLKLGPISVGRRAFVGTRAFLAEGSSMGDDTRLGDLSLLPRGARIPRGERWAGAPAMAQAGLEAGDSPGPWRRPSRAARLARALAFAVGTLLIPVFIVGAIFPGMIVMNELNYLDDYYWYLGVAPLVALSFIVFLTLEIAAFKWLLLGRVKPGRYDLNGLFYWKKWFVDQLMALSLDVVGSLYSTIYLAPWYRLLGARLGKRAEVSTASFISPDLLEIGDEGFVADNVSLGAPRFDRGTMTIGPTRIGRRSFIGNSALLPPGSSIGESSLIGCQSVPPPGNTTDEGSSWLGSPAVYLPQRQASASFSEESTFRPTRKLRAQRAAIELVRVVFPSTCFVVATSVLLSSVLMIHESMPLWQLALVFPVMYIEAGVAAALFMVAAKWVLMGRYKPGERPLWSTFVWRTELLTALHENLADIFLTDMLRGTPFLPWFFRLLGAKIGRRVFLNTTELTEFDLVKIGDDAALNQICTMQTHLFEDRVMKMSTITIGQGCAVGASSLVLYDTVMEDGSKLGPLSLLMKGESLPAGTTWDGIPARCSDLGGPRRDAGYYPRPHRGIVSVRRESSSDSAVEGAEHS